MSHFHPLKITKINREISRAISIVFDVPFDLQSQYNFVAGQYINLKVDINGKEIRRAYSICSAHASKELKIVIKSVPNGVFSTYANNVLKEGDIVEVGIPEGRFILEPDASSQKNYLSFAAGSGITPIMSIIKTVLSIEPLSSFILVYGNKTPEETIFYKELYDLQMNYTGRFFVYYVFSRAKVENSLFGRIERSTVNFVLNNKHASIIFDKFYICGPEEMTNTVKEVLIENNVKEKKIKFELFISASNEKNVQNVSIDQTRVRVIVDGEERSFVMPQQMILLDAVLKQGIDAPYSCQGGICSSCMARVIEGTAMMKKNTK